MQYSHAYLYQAEIDYRAERMPGKAGRRGTPVRRRRRHRRLDSDPAA